MSLLPAPSHPILTEIHVFIESFSDSATAVGGSPRYLQEVTWKENQFYVKEMFLVNLSPYKDNRADKKKRKRKQTSIVHTVQCIFQQCIQYNAFPNSLLTQSLLAIDIPTLSDGAWWKERYAVCEQVYWRTLSNSSSPAQKLNQVSLEKWLFGQTASWPAFKSVVSYCHTSSTNCTWF